MKNLKIKSLLAAAALVCQSVLADADAEQSRTYFMPMNVTSSMPAHSNSVARLMEEKQSDDAIGLLLSGWVGYQQVPETRSGNEMAKALMSGKTNSVKLYGGAQNTANGDVPLQQMFISATNPKIYVDSGDTATITLSKLEHRRIAGGLNLCYDAAKFYEGLYFGGELSFAHEKNKVTLTSTSAKVTTAALDPAVAVLTVLKGDQLDAGEFQQVPALTSLKIASGTVMSKTAVNELCLHAGLKVVDNETARLCFAVVGSIPLGQERKVEFLFQPNPGERQYKLGVKGCALLKLVSDEDYNINLNLGGCWKYAFKKSNENYNPQRKADVWAHYQLASKGNTAATIVPLSNLLADLKVEVSGASEFCAWAQLALEKGCFGAAVGYNLCYLQEKTLTPTYPNEKLYQFDNIGISRVAGLLTAGSAATAGTNAQAKEVPSSEFVNSEPSKLAHNVSVEANWKFCEWDYPLSVGVTGSYQLARDRKYTPEYWTVGVHGGVSF